MLTAFVGSTLLLAACGSPQDPSPPRAPAAQPATVRVFASSAAAPVGSRISVSLGGSMADGTPLAGVDGWLRFTPAALRYVGSAEDSATTIAANDSGAVRGRVRVVAVRPGRLEPDAPVLAFDVLKPDYLSSLTFEAGAAVGPTGKLQRGGGTRRAEVRGSLSASVAVRPAVAGKRLFKQLVVPTIYGDADASGAVAQADADLVGEWIVGNGAPPDTVTFNIVNVGPQNLPGIGGPTDTFPPGWGPPFMFGGGFLRQRSVSDPPIALVCERMLNLDDLLLISQEAGGTNVEVPGELMPAGSVRPACADPAPGAWPVFAGTLPPFDAGPVVTVTALDGSSETYLRTGASIRFEAGVIDSEKQEIVSRFGLTVLGATDASRQRIFVTFQDPGATYADLQAFLNSVQNDPGVAGVLPILVSPVKEMSDARFPIDGSGQQRADWIGAALSTWAYRAIRAPLAWGCETGSYSTQVPRVAVLEWDFDAAHPEYGGLVTRSWVLTDSITYLPVAPVDTVNARVDHSTAVVGTLSAIGDNGSGTAGVVWRSALHLYAMRNSRRQAIPLSINFYVIADEIIRDRPRILSLSADQALSGPTQAVRDTAIASVALEFRRVLDSIPELLVVLATGNERINEALSVYRTRTTPSVGLLRLALLTLRNNPNYVNRIIVVTGSQANNQFASPFPNPQLGSNYFTGLTDIAAPAVDVPTLRRRTGSTIPVSLQFGTSLAAPIVAGVAAQLLSMDPSLTTEQVRDYILRGAQEPKQDPLTGAVPAAGDSVARRVQGAPGPLYQLDAYGSLTLLSRERQGTPLCGLEMVYRNNPAQQTNSVTANRQAPELIIAGAPAPTLLWTGLSVAQGGRRLAIGRHPYTLQAGTWVRQDSVPGVDQIVYLERDTARMRGVTNFSGVGSRTDLFVRINNEPERNITGSYPGGQWSAGFGASVSSVSPTGDYVHVSWDYDDSRDFCGPTSRGGGSSQVVRLRGGSTTYTLSAFSYPLPCDTSPVVITGNPESGVVHWRRDGAELLRAVYNPEESGYSYRLLRYDAASGISLVSTGPLIAGYRPVDLDWAPEGGRITLREIALGPDSCRLAIRRSTPPHGPLEPELPLNPEACAWRPRVAPLRDRLLATITSGSPATGARGASTARLRRDAHGGRRPAEYFTRAN